MLTRWSTEAALHQIVTPIEVGQEGGFYSLGTFLDIAEAFVNAIFESTSSSLTKCGEDVTLVRWVRAMLT